MRMPIRYTLPWEAYSDGRFGMRRFLVALVAVFAMCSLSYAGVKIGVVNVQKIVFNCKRGKQAKAQWEKEFAQKKKEIEKKQKEIERLREELKKNAAVLSEKAKKKKEEELRRKTLELQFAKQEAMKYLQQRNMELVDAILKDVLKKIEEFGKKNGYTLIIDVSGKVVYRDKKVDLTDTMIKLMDQGTAKKK